MKKPDFIVVGAVKSGTTSLFHYLSQHPDIFLPRSKEISYFAGSDRAGHVRDLNEYLSFFSGARPHQKIGEVSTAYLYSATAAADIAEQIGRDLKIIIMLRNPVDVVYSLWGQNIRDGAETLSLEDALAAEPKRVDDPAFRAQLRGWIYNYAYVDRALYTGQVQRYVEVFGRENVAVFIFEEFFANIDSSLRELFAFIGVDSDFRLKHYTAHNRQGRVRSRWLHRLYFENSRLAELVRLVLPARYRRAIMMTLYRLNTKTSRRTPLTREQRQELMMLFEKDIRKLEHLIDRDLSGVWDYKKDAVVSGRENRNASSF